MILHRDRFIVVMHFTTSNAIELPMAVPLSIAHLLEPIDLCNVGRLSHRRFFLIAKN